MESGRYLHVSGLCEFSHTTKRSDLLGLFSSSVFSLSQVAPQIAIMIEDLSNFF